MGLQIDPSFHTYGQLRFKVASLTLNNVNLYLHDLKYAYYYFSFCNFKWHFAMKNQQQLLNLLKENSRRTVSDLASELGLSRATVQQSMARLEHTGIIQGYTVKINPHFEQQRVSAYIMISVVAKKTTDIVRQLNKHSQLDMLCTISGQYDLMAQVTESTTEALDLIIDAIATLDGVEKTLSHIVLSRKVDR
tara:strand:+ start:10030 stop:10605 length:576 start_codon:yes stop_codon:yes gene_type:complete